MASQLSPAVGTTTKPTTWTKCASAPANTTTTTTTTPATTAAAHTADTGRSALG